MTLANVLTSHLDIACAGKLIAELTIAFLYLDAVRSRGPHVAEIVVILITIQGVSVLQRTPSWARHGFDGNGDLGQ